MRSELFPCLYSLCRLEAPGQQRGVRKCEILLGRFLSSLGALSEDQEFALSKAPCTGQGVSFAG